jgi:hypothetical protein
MVHDLAGCATTRHSDTLHFNQMSCEDRNGAEADLFKKSDHNRNEESSQGETNLTRLADERIELSNGQNLGDRRTLNPTDVDPLLCHGNQRLDPGFDRGQPLR